MFTEIDEEEGEQIEEHKFAGMIIGKKHIKYTDYKVARSIYVTTNIINYFVLY